VSGVRNLDEYRDRRADMEHAAPVDPRRILAPIPRLALTRQEAADALGMGLTSFEEHVQPTLRLVRLGRMRLVPVAELERWLADNAEHVIPT
jgi:hypothetical protein